ncbi:MAG: AAA family ATPase [Rhodanobacter sp.]
MDLQFFSPDEKRAQRLSARLRNFANVQWLDGCMPLLGADSRGQASVCLVLLDYSPDAAEESSAMARRLVLHAPDLPLVGVGSTGLDRATGVLAALRAGVHDFLDLDASDDEIRNLLARVQSQAELARMARVGMPRTRGRMVVLLGVRPGVGSSTLAAHLGALAMPSQEAKESGISTGGQALLLDLGRPAGDASLYLGVDGEFRYDDALRSAGRIDPTLIRTALPRHAGGLALLSQAPETRDPPRGDAEAGVLVERLRDYFGLLLCDLGGLPVGLAPLPLLRGADGIWLVADQGIGSMVSLDAALRDLERLGLRDTRLGLVVNRYDEAGGASAEQLAERFGLPLLAVLPERSRALRASANRGLLLHQVSPRDPYVRALNPLLEKLHVNVVAPAGLASWKRLFHRMGGFLWKNA